MKRDTYFAARLALISVAVLGGFAGRALAEPTEAEKRTEAETIFAQAKDLMDKKDYANACPKLEEVVKLQPRGIGAKISLADCYIGEGRLASAHAMLGEAASLAVQENQADRASAVQGKAQELEGKLSKLTITIPNTIATTPGLTVVRDGTQLSQALYNVTVPIDGGTHTVIATAPHMKPFETKLDVPAESGAVTVNVVLIPEGPASNSAPPGGANAGGQLRGSAWDQVKETGHGAGEAGEDGTFWSPVRIGGVVVGGAGLVPVAAGIGIGVSGAAKTGTAADEFTAAKAMGDVAGENKALQDHADAHNQAVGGWITTGIGGAALVTGIVMIAAGPRGHKSASNSRTQVVPVVSGTTKGVVVTGEF